MCCGVLLSAFILTGLAIKGVFFHVIIRAKLRFAKGKEISPTSHSLFGVQGRLGNFYLRGLPNFFAEIFHTFVNLKVAKVRQCINYPVAELFLRLEYFINLFLSFDVGLEIDTNEIRVNTLDSIIENVLNALVDRAEFLFFNNLLDCFLKIFTHE